MKHGSLFSGIGGFDLAAEWMGWENVFHCEINPFGQKILKHYWPNAISYDDITTTDFTVHRGHIDILTGGFPCQPFSLAGKRKGTEDHRNLWPEYYRAIKEIQPDWVVGENVFGIINWSNGLVFEQVQSDLENEGYEVWPVILPACGINAPHRRNRTWFVAKNTKFDGRLCREFEQEGAEIREQRHTCPGNSEWFCQSEDAGTASDSICTRCETEGEQSFPTTQDKRTVNLRSGWDGFPTQPPICGGNDGLPRELDSITFSKWRNESIKAYGNAVVPPLVYEIFKAIEKINRT